MLKNIFYYMLTIFNWMLQILLRLAALLINIIIFLSMLICGILGFGIFGLFLYYVLACTYTAIIM